MVPILKSLQIAILCGSILNLQSIALAQDLGAEISKTAQTSSASSTSASAGTGTTIAAIKNDGNMMSSITMIAIGFLATQLFKYKKTGDILLALGGGAAFIGGEIMSTNSFKDMAKDLEVPSKNPDAAQIESLQKLKKSYEDAKKTTNTKKMLQMAAAGAFGVAGIMAVMMKTKEVVDEKATDASIAAASAAAAAAAAAAASTCSSSATQCEQVAPANKASADIAAAGKKKKVDDAARDTKAPSKIKEKETETARISTETILKTTGTILFPLTAATIKATPKLKELMVKFQTEAAKKKAENESSKNSAIEPQGPPAPTTPAPTENIPTIHKITPNPGDSLVINYSKPSTKLSENLLNLFFHSAHADTMKLLMPVGGIALGILLNLVKPDGKLNSAVDKFLAVPKNRAIIWGILAGLSFAASSASSKTIEQLDSNIKKIDGILKPMEENAPGTTTPNASSTPPTTTWLTPLLMSLISSSHASTLQNQTPVYRLGNGKEKMSCLDRAGETNCSSLKSYAARMPIFKELSPGIKSHAIDVLTMSDGFNGTSSFGGASIAAANRLAENQPAIAKTFEAYKNNLNKILVNDKRRQIDFKKEESWALNYFNNETAKALQMNKVSPSQFLASVNPALLRGAMDASKSASDFSYSPADLDNESNEAEESNAEVAKSLSQDAYFPRDTSGMGNTHFEDRPVAKKEYDIGSNDINTDKNSSIFEVISSRYIKSYNKLQD